MSLEAGRIIGDKYVLERLLGEGGMGSVWIARHRVLDAAVAIKFLRTDRRQHAMARMRFEREAKAAASLRTRHAVKVHDFGVDGHRAYIVMEMLEGEDLGARLMRMRRLAPEETLPIVWQACKGLHHAHAAGIVHRDLKPANIFLSLADGEELVKILDFGIAKMMNADSSSEENTKTGMLLGSPHYMSPEHIRGLWKQLDHRSDLWSLAVIAYRMLTSRMPFPGELLSDVMLNVCHGSAPPVSSLVPSLPTTVDRFFERALARDPATRFQSAAELADAFQAAFGGAPRREAWSSPDDPSPQHLPAPKAVAPPAVAPPEATVSLEPTAPQPEAAPAPPVSPWTQVAAPTDLETARAASANRWPSPPSSGAHPSPRWGDGLSGVTEQGVVRGRPLPYASQAASVAAAGAALFVLATAGWGVATLSAAAPAQVETWTHACAPLAGAAERAHHLESTAAPKARETRVPPRKPAQQSETVEPASSTSLAPVSQGRGFNPGY